MAKLLDSEPSRRDSILNAALKEFITQGYDKASTNVIAKEAGISKALMFHYAGSKKELFFTVYDYFSEKMDKEYFELLNYNEPDIFLRLRQSYLLQLKLTDKYPWILDFYKLTQSTDCSQVNEELEYRKRRKEVTCYPQIFQGIEETRFRKELDIETCKQFIYWANIGFTNQLLEEIRKPGNIHLDNNTIMERIDGCLMELRKIFYSQGMEGDSR